MNCYSRSSLPVFILLLRHSARCGCHPIMPLGARWVFAGKCCSAYCQSAGSWVWQRAEPRYGLAVGLSLGLFPWRRFTKRVVRQHKSNPWVVASPAITRRLPNATRHGSTCRCPPPCSPPPSSSWWCATKTTPGLYRRSAGRCLYVQSTGRQSGRESVSQLR